MVKLFELMKKNFRLLLRSKTSSLIIFMGPLILVFLLGLSYSQSSSYTLTASVYSAGYTEISESLITKMSNQNFNVIKEETQENCIGAVKRGDSQACITFPAFMTLQNDDPYEVTFYVDYAQINLVWLILDVMSARVSEQSDEISKELTSDVLDRLWFVEERLKEGKDQIVAMESSGSNIKAASDTMKGGVQKLDISVDFSAVDFASGNNATTEVQTALSAIRNSMDNLTSSATTYASRIEESVTYIEGSVNDSGVKSELDDIDDGVDDITNAVDDANEIIDGDISNASENIARIRDVLDGINQDLKETEAKIDSVKNKRDELVPQFAGIETEVASLDKNLKDTKENLNTALEKVSGIKIKNANKISAPIKTVIEPVSGQKTHFNSLFPTLIVLIIMITGILLSATLVIVEKRSKAFFRNNMTPTSYAMFSMSTYLTSLVIMLIQLLLFVSISAFFFETEVLASIFLLILIIFLVCTVFICIGMFIGFIFKTEETVNLAAITLAAIFLLFSSAVIPLESLPGYIKNIAMFNPFVVSELAMRQTLIYQFSIEKVSTSLIILGAYAIGIFIVLLILQKVMRRILFIQFSKPPAAGKKAEKKIAPAQPVKEEKHSIDELHVKKK